MTLHLSGNAHNGASPHAYDSVSFMYAHTHCIVQTSPNATTFRSMRSSLVSRRSDPRGSMEETLLARLISMLERFSQKSPEWIDDFMAPPTKLRSLDRRSGGQVGKAPVHWSRNSLEREGASAFAHVGCIEPHIIVCYNRLTCRPDQISTGIDLTQPHAAHEWLSVSPRGSWLSMAWTCRPLVMASVCAGRGVRKVCHSRCEYGTGSIDELCSSIVPHCCPLAFHSPIPSRPYHLALYSCCCRCLDPSPYMTLS